MLRENKDVFEAFTNNLVNILYDNKSLELIEGLVHLMMKDLTCSQMNKKLIYIIYQSIYKSNMTAEKTTDFDKFLVQF